jgi:hypothetical protein
MNPEEMENKIGDLERKSSAILSLLAKVLDPEGKMMLNLTAENLEVYVTLQKKELTKNLDTSTANGRILYCAVEDLKLATFSESEMSRCLSERAWPSTHGAIAPVLSRLVSDNMLIRENTSGPAKYRIPGKITVTVREG